MGLALVKSGWIMWAVLGANRAFSPAQTEELELTTVSILKMWQFPVLVLVLLVLTAASSAPVRVLGTIALWVGNQ